MLETVLAVMDNDIQKNELAVFYEQYKNRLYNIAYSKLNNQEDAEDAVQEAFLRIAESPDKFFSLNKKDRIYFFQGIIRHVSIDKFNQKTKKDAVPFEEINEDLPADDISPEEKNITDASADELVQFLLTLPESQRDTLFLYVHQKLSYREIADLLQISEGLARKRVSNARKAIKAYVEGRLK